MARDEKLLAYNGTQHNYFLDCSLLGWLQSL